MAITNPPKGDADKKIGAQFAPLSVSPQDTPSMTVKIRAGWFYNANGDAVEYSGGNSPTIVPPGSNAKWVIVAINNSGSIALVNGTAAATPALPTLPAGHMPLAFVYVTNTTTAITSDKVFDARPLFRSVDVVPNLSAELADRPTFTDMTNALANKADVDGTPNFTFSLNNADASAADAMFAVKRGAGNDVALRWNESTDKWQFTNDGITFVDMAAVSGTFMPLVPTAVAGNVATFNASGEVVDSLQSLTGLATDVELATKADKVTGAVSGNFAGLNGSGNLTDSGFDSTDFAAATHTHAQTDVTGLVAALAAKADVAGETFTGDITVQSGANQPITLSSRDTGSSGLLVDRTGPADAVLEWDESTDQWVAGVVGAAFPILTAENLALTDLTDVGTLTPAAGDVLRFVGGTWVDDPLSDKANVGHTHVKADITDFAHTHVKADITDFAHTHVAADVTDFSTAADARITAATGVSVAAFSHTHAAADVTSGTFADARIAASNVTQHVASIDHDSLLNFVANEHVDHTSVTLTAGTGLTGGGDISANRTFNVAALKGSTTFDFASISSQSSADTTINVPGAVVGDVVHLGRPTPSGTGTVGDVIMQAWVSAADTVTLRAFNPTGGAVDLDSATYNVLVFQYAEF